MFSFKNNFAAGELSPAVQSRIDLAAYKNGAITMENVIPRPQGGFVRRPGSVFVARAKYKNKTFRLIPFQYNISQTYMLEVGEGYIRFHTQRARLEQTATNITNCVDNGSGLIRVTSASHGLSTGNYVAIRNVKGTYEANDDWQVTVIDPNTFDLVGSTFTNTYTSGGTAAKIIEITAPWQEADLPDLRFAQDADVMFLVHPDYWPQQLTRTSALVFTLTQIDNVVASTEARWLHGPFGPINGTTTHTMTWGGGLGVGSSSTMTSSSAYFTNDMIGMYFRYAGESGGEQGYLRITAVGSSTPITTATMTVESALTSAAATSNWALGSWGEYTGYPVDVTFFDGRLCFSGTATEPQTIWMSAIDGAYDFRVGTADSEPVTIPVRTNDANVIQWISAQDDILVGTQGGEFFMTGGADATITPTNKQIKQPSSFGSDALRSLKVGSTVLYVQRAGERIRDLAFKFDEDKYISDDLSLLSNHILKANPVVDWAFQLSPEPIIWTVLTNGSLATITIIKSQEVLSWARHTVTNALCEAIGVVPRDSVNVDDVWVGTKRTINSETVRYIEYLDADSMLDCATLSTLSPAATTVSGADYLEGETVSIVGDSAPYDNQTITNGTLTVSTDEPAITALQLGYVFVPKVIPVPPVFDLPDGTSYGRKIRYSKVLVLATDTLTMELNGTTAPARDPSDLMDTVPATETDAIFQFTSFGNAEIPQLVLRQPLPLPWDVRGIFGEVSIGK